MILRSPLSTKVPTVRFDPADSTIRGRAKSKIPILVIIFCFRFFNLSPRSTLNVTYLVQNELVWPHLYNSPKLRYVIGKNGYSRIAILWFAGLKLRVFFVSGEDLVSKPSQ